MSVVLRGTRDRNFFDSKRRELSIDEVTGGSLVFGSTWTEFQSWLRDTAEFMETRGVNIQLPEGKTLDAPLMRRMASSKSAKSALRLLPNMPEEILTGVNIRDLFAAIDDALGALDDTISKPGSTIALPEEVWHQIFRSELVYGVDSESRTILATVYKSNKLPRLASPGVLQTPRLYIDSLNPNAAILQRVTATPSSYKGLSRLERRIPAVAVAAIRADARNYQFLPAPMKAHPDFIRQGLASGIKSEWIPQAALAEESLLIDVMQRDAKVILRAPAELWKSRRVISTALTLDPSLISPFQNGDALHPAVSSTTLAQAVTYAVKHAPDGLATLKAFTPYFEQRPKLQYQLGDLIGLLAAASEARAKEDENAGATRDIDSDPAAAAFDAFSTLPRSIASNPAVWVAWSKTHPGSAGGTKIVKDIEALSAQDMSALQERVTRHHITQFSRFASLEQLELILDNLENPGNGPFAQFIAARADNNGALRDLHSTVDKLEKNFTVIYHEVDTQEDFINALIFEAETRVYLVHGSEESMGFGSYNFTPEDIPRIQALLMGQQKAKHAKGDAKAKRLTKNVILDSCSTGKGSDAHSNITNGVEVFHSGAHIFGPQEDSYSMDISYRKKSETFKVHYPSENGKKRLPYYHIFPDGSRKDGLK